MDKWNINMSLNFSSSWISCLNKSMSKWIGRYSCLGHMCVPFKLWPLDNKYHTICCGETEILYQAEIVKGKDEPKECTRKEFHNLGKTVSLLLCLTRTIWGTSKVVILDLDFCVLQGIVELLKWGIFALALIKKRHDWPRFIKGNIIAQHFQNL